jgi:hypothetical protein
MVQKGVQRPNAAMVESSPSIANIHFNPAPSNVNCGKITVLQQNISCSRSRNAENQFIDVAHAVASAIQLSIAILTYSQSGSCRTLHIRGGKGHCKITGRLAFSPLYSHIVPCSVTAGNGWHDVRPGQTQQATRER